MTETAVGRPALNGVTLVAVTSVALPATIEALRASMRQARFERVLLLSDHPPVGDSSGIEWVEIAPLRSRSDYSRFMLRQLADYVETPHVLCVQWDGFVLNGGAWDPAFLECDYIGAVWPQFPGPHNVGNGGFSLRSRRLLEACKDLPFEDGQAEDVLICRDSRDSLEQRGFRFAPESLARRFAYERTRPSGREFGFHGAFNLARLLPPAEALRLFRSLEPAVLARSERAELLRWAIGKGRPRLALEMLRRLW